MTTTGKTLGTLLGEVSAEMARIEKKGNAPQSMGGFPFVRETDVIEALKPLLDKHGIFIRPDVEDVRLDLYPRQGKDGPGVLATVRMAFWAVRGEEEVLLARTPGQGSDTQDKAVGKAVTAAKKQALLIAFAIPTGDDPEATHLDSTNGTQAAPRPAQRAPAAPAQASADTGDGGTCPVHHKPWRTNSRGFYCASKDPSTESGWCDEKPSAAWAAAQEVV